MGYVERIRELREDNDYNTTYSDYEKGKVRMPIECVVELAKFYNVDLNLIIGVSDVRNEFPKE